MGMTRWIRWWCWPGLLGLLCLGVSVEAVAQTKPKPAPALSAENIRQFFNKQIPLLMKKHHIVGTTFAAVHQGEIVFAKGFGVRDLKSKAAIDPNTTLFRAGSISKLFTWTAVMQLVEQGKLDLHKDIQTYLKDVRIPKTFAKPITLAHLMAHTPGFEDQIIGLFTKDPSEGKLLKQIAMDVPKRIRPPGQQVAYSNYGVSLAGYIVEQVSGMPFEAYVEKHIFQPLRMKNATFRQPVPKSLASQLATGYVYDKKQNRYLPQAFEIVQGIPAGGLTVAATDMARFLLAHLQQGKLGEARILKTETVQKMHTTHSRMARAANGMAHGFMEFQARPPRIIGHGGDTIYFHSLCFIIPSHQFGFFVSNNTSTGMLLSFGLYEAFLKHFFPSPDGETLAKAYREKNQNLQPYLGEYQANRRSESDLGKLLTLGMVVRVRPSEKGGLEIYNFFQGKFMRYVEVAPDVFQRADGFDRFIFLRNKQGQVYATLMNTMPVMLFVKPPWYEKTWLQLFILGCAALFFLTGLIFRPTGLLMLFSRKHRTGGMEAWAGYTGLGMISVYLLFIAAVFLTLSSDFIFTTPNMTVFLIPYVALVLNLVMLVFTVQAWRQSFWGLWGRLHYSLLTLSALGLFWFLQHWKVV